MLKASSVPTPLIAYANRPAVPIAPVRSTASLSGILTVLRLLWWSATTLLLYLSGRGDATEYGRRFRLLLEDLGGLWIKLGQLLSLRIDLFPAPFCRELSNLQVKAIGFPVSDAMRIIEEELGGSLATFFRTFEETPAAAASIGQVHLAFLRQPDVRVAVKVQRPNLPRTFFEQIRIMRWIFRTVRLFGLRPHLRWDDLLWELNHIMREEMDCRYEASSTRRMRRRLRAHGVYVPKVFYATERVLITEFVDGVLMGDYIQMTGSDPQRVKMWQAENGIDPSEVGRRLALSLLRQMIEDNLYHGDLHPGNIMLLRDNGVALIDFGTCSFSERQFLQFYRLLFSALALRDYARAADIAFHLSGTMPPTVDADQVRREYAQAFRIWGRHTGVRGLPFHEKSVTVIYNAMVRILYEHHATMDWSLLRLRRALETLDSSLVYLIPDANYTSVLSDYFRQADNRMANRIRDSAPAALTRAGAALDLPQRIDEYTLFQGEILRRHGFVFQSATNRAVYALSTMIGQLALLGVLASGLALASLVAQHGAATAFGAGVLRRLLQPVPRLDWQVWALLLTATAGGSMAVIRLRGRLQRHEPRAAERVAPV